MESVNDEGIKQFQSAPLIRGETIVGDQKHGTNVISIRSPHTRGDLIALHFRAMIKFQSAPLIRGETVGVLTTSNNLKFQSAPLIRGETLKNIA